MRPIGASPVHTHETNSSVENMMDSVNLGSVLNGGESTDRGDLTERKRGRQNGMENLF